MSQQTLDVFFIMSGNCADASGQLTNCVLHVRTIVTSPSRFVQDSVMVIKFLETECVGPLEFTKTKVFAQLLSRSHKRLQTFSLAVSGTKNDQETLEACQSPNPNAL